MCVLSHQPPPASSFICLGQLMRHFHRRQHYAYSVTIVQSDCLRRKEKKRKSRWAQKQHYSLHVELTQQAKMNSASGLAFVCGKIKNKSERNPGSKFPDKLGNHNTKDLSLLWTSIFQIYFVGFMEPNLEAERSE